ncbi:hypothetical protein EAG18_13130 [Pseudoalteromonas sp. J010]|uniref:phage tail protein n=1 Tax=Pseudoalteromonas sp. J010 TaxID=998465 RepID=UPI000F647269|nr:tail fiber protein [Pseudoalteromonas sp. J010]RRS08240.1 hypothetical protein EAG18_13130 [Pseudoalteromonas sp. J010]
MSDEYTGQIMPCGFHFAPVDFAFCMGGTVQITQYTAVFALLGTYFGGDGRVSFGLPDFRGRSPLGYGTSPYYGPFNMGQFGGGDSFVLTESNLPPHHHGVNLNVTGAGDATTTQVTLNATQLEGDSATPQAGAYLATAPDIPGPDAPEKIYYTGGNPSSTVALGGIEVTQTGSASGHVSGETGVTGAAVAVRSRSPYQAVNYVICMEGIFPQRN